jgi:hypothetical protein
MQLGSEAASIVMAGQGLLQVLAEFSPAVVGRVALTSNGIGSSAAAWQGRGQACSGQ